MVSRSPGMDARDGGSVRKVELSIHVTSDGSMPELNANQLAEYVRGSDLIRALERMAEAG